LFCFSILFFLWSFKMLSLNQSVKTALAKARANGHGLNVVHGVDTRLTHRVHARTHDAWQTYDRATVDSTGVFLISELERLDQRLHEPLLAYTWARDIDLREDVTMGDEESSFTNSSFASGQGIAGSNKAWASKEASTIVGVSVDIGKTVSPLPLWMVQLSWTLPELISAQQLGRPIDQQKFSAMMMKYNMDLDEETYTGDVLLKMNGLLNHSALTNTGNAVTGGWATATAQQILADVNALLVSVWAATGYALMPDRLLIDPASYAILRSTLISTAGSQSILTYLLENNVAVGQTVSPFQILPCKWLTGTATQPTNPLGIATNSMFAYTKDKDRVRLPLVPLQRTPIEYRDIRQITTYFGRIGGVEMVYPEVCGRRSNL
jgi:hypothetical protein